MDLDNLVALYKQAEASGYVLLPDDYMALGYAAMNVNDYNRVLFVVAQANLALKFSNPDLSAKPNYYYQMAKYKDGTYGLR